jgi:hypothetical protein
MILVDVIGGDIEVTSVILIADILAIELQDPSDAPGERG